MGIKSAYRQLKETVRGPDKQYQLDVLKEQLDRYWAEVTKEGLTANPQLLNLQQLAQAQLDAREPKAAGKLIQELAALIPVVKLATLEQAHRDRQTQKTAALDAAGKVLAEEFERDAGALTAKREPAPLKRTTQAAQPRMKEAVMTLDKTLPPVALEGKNFVSRMTVDGETFEAPEYIAKGGFGVTARYTAASGNTLVMKAVLDYGGELEKELEINRKLSEGPIDAPGRENVLLMKGFTKGDDGTAYILMDEAAGDLNMMKHGMNALSEAGGLPEEVRNVLNQQMMKQALQGAKYMHDQGVDHFDLKEGNMLMMPDGTVKLIDFGGSLADGKEGEMISPVTTAPYSPKDGDGMMHGEFALQRNKWDAFSLGTMLETMHHGENPLGRGGALTGSLGRVHDSMTEEAAQERTTLESALESSYFRNLDNYEPETIKELMAATAAYSSALRGREVNGKKVTTLSEDLHHERQLLQKHEAKMKDAKMRGQALDVEGWRAKQAVVKALEADLRLLANDADLQPHRDRISEISQRLQRGA